jgi:hypothetical protein
MRSAAGVTPANMKTIITTDPAAKPSRWPRVLAAVLIVGGGAGAWYVISQMKPLQAPVVVEPPPPKQPPPKAPPEQKPAVAAVEDPPAKLTTTVCSAPLEVSNTGGKMWVAAAVPGGTALKLVGPEDAPLGMAFVVETAEGKARLIADASDRLPERMLACPRDELPISGQLVMKGATSAGITNTSSGTWTDCDLLLPNNTMARLPRGTVFKPGKQHWVNGLHFAPRKVGSGSLNPTRATVRCEEGEFDLELLAP